MSNHQPSSGPSARGDAFARWSGGCCLGAGALAVKVDPGRGVHVLVLAQGDACAAGSVVAQVLADGAQAGGSGGVGVVPAGHGELIRNGEASLGGGAQCTEGELAARRDQGIGPRPRLSPGAPS